LNCIRKGIKEMLRDMDSIERKKIDSEIDKGALLIGSDIYYGEPPATFDRSEFGICWDCRELRACKTKYGKTMAKCWEFDIVLNANDPIEECTCYKKRNEMDLNMMKDIAILLDVDKKQAGFILDD
jgi:hypothetical protein